MIDQIESNGKQCENLDCNNIITGRRAGAKYCCEACGIAVRNQKKKKSNERKEILYSTLSELLNAGKSDASSEILDIEIDISDKDYIARHPNKGILFDIKDIRIQIYKNTVYFKYIKIRYENKTYDTESRQFEHSVF